MVSTSFCAVVLCLCPLYEDSLVSYIRGIFGRIMIEMVNINTLNDCATRVKDFLCAQIFSPPMYRQSSCMTSSPLPTALCTCSVASTVWWTLACCVWRCRRWRTACTALSRCAALSTRHAPAVWSKTASGAPYKRIVRQQLCTQLLYYRIVSPRLLVKTTWSPLGVGHKMNILNWVGCL